MPETTFLDASELVINMGPQHPATHGVLRMKLKRVGYYRKAWRKIKERRPQY